MSHFPETTFIKRLLDQLQTIQEVIPVEKCQFDSIENDRQFISNVLEFVDSTRLTELRSIYCIEFDLSKLIRYCEELNSSYENGCYLSVAMLVRAIIDHVPPIFNCANFTQVVNNYPGGTKSFKQSMEHLEKSLRKIADAHLHVQIRKSESLPNKTQINFSQDLDVMLAEIVRLLQTPKANDL